MRVLLFIIAPIILFSRCTDQRDLYATAHPMLYIEGDWTPSLNIVDMSMNATACVYAEGNDQLVRKDYFVSPRSVTVPLSRGAYGILLFNGMMYSEETTHLDNVFFRGTGQLSTFEAVVKEGETNRRLMRSENEYIASNGMEILTSAHRPAEITGKDSYYLKYKNGENGYPVVDDYIERELYMTPAAVSYKCQVKVKMINPESARIANGALKGFVGSVFMAERMPSHMDVTHQFRLNDLQITADTGTIQSPVFVTFGPPLDLPDRQYTLELSIILANGDLFNQTIPITDQITPVIDKIKANLGPGQAIDVNLTIPVEIIVELPIVDPGAGDIGVGDWDDDEIIRVPIKW